MDLTRIEFATALGFIVAFACLALDLFLSGVFDYETQAFSRIAKASIGGAFLYVLFDLALQWV